MRIHHFTATQLWSCSSRLPRSFAFSISITGILLGRLEPVWPQGRKCFAEADQTSADDAHGGLDERPEIGRSGVPGLLFGVSSPNNGFHADGGGEADEEADGKDYTEADLFADGHLETRDDW